MAHIKISLVDYQDLENNAQTGTFVVNIETNVSDLSPLTAATINLMAQVIDRVLQDEGAAIATYAQKLLEHEQAELDDQDTQLH